MEPEELCACGQPLHYTSAVVRGIVETYIMRYGPTVVVSHGDKRYRVPRHYLALHGLRAADLDALGFPEVPPEG